MIRLAEVPLFLGFWGPRLYGEWLMLFTIPSYLTLGNGGFCVAACHDMTMQGQTGERHGVLATFQSTWLLIIMVSITILACVAIFVSVAPLTCWLGFSVIGEGQVKIVLFLLTMYILAGFQYSLLSGGFLILGRYPMAMALQALTQSLEFAGLACAIILGYGPIGAATGLLAGRLLGVGIYWAFQRRLTPWLRHGISHASFSEIRRLFAPSLASLALPLGDALNIQGIRLIVGLVLGPPAVAVFATMRTMARLARQPPNVVSRLLEPELSIAFGLKDGILFTKLLAKSCQAALWGCLTACLLLLPAARWLYPLWTAHRIAIHWPTFIILLAVSLVNGVWYTSLMAPYSTNRHGRIAAYYWLIYGGAVFGLGYLGAAWIGFRGAALALLAAECAMTAVVVHASARMTDMGVAEFFKTIAHPPFDFLRRGLDAVINRSIQAANERGR